MIRPYILNGMQYVLILRLLLRSRVVKFEVIYDTTIDLEGNAIQSLILSVLKVSDSIVPDYVLYLFLYKNILRYAIELSVSFVSKKVLTKFCLSAL